VTCARNATSSGNPSVGRAASLLARVGIYFVGPNELLMIGDTMRKALIIGGGVAGPVAAMALQRAGLEAIVYEAHPRPPRRREHRRPLTRGGLFTVINYELQ